MTLDNTHRPLATILCIDDDPAILSALEMRLAQFNVEVLAACSGTQGIWRAVTEHPDVVICDMRMPSGNGDYVVECLKGRVNTCDIPVIVLTGRRDQEIERWMMVLGIESYLHKPVKFEVLLATLSKYITLEPVGEPA